MMNAPTLGVTLSIKSLKMLKIDVRFRKSYLNFISLPFHRDHCPIAAIAYHICFYKFTDQIRAAGMRFKVESSAKIICRPAKMIN